MKINTDSDDIFRACVDEVNGNCPYVKKNQYGVYVCDIDGVIGCRWFCCRPSETKLLIEQRKLENENY